MENHFIKTSTFLEIESPYYLGINIENEFINKIREYKFDVLYIVIDKNVYDIYGKEFVATLNNIKFSLIKIDGKEYNKTMLTLNELCETLISKGITKSSIIVAFGGGVIGNIVGLAASLIYRGVRYIEIPTTFMGQTDSTLSNKQAVNGRNSKNLFGCYYAPIFIWSDIKYILSEDNTRIKSGLVETVKNGLIHNKAVLKHVEEYMQTDLKSPIALYNIIYQSIQSKIEILQIDPTEKGYAMILEYGHTFGHSIEKLCKGNLSHGEAVAIGMTIAAHLSYNIGIMSSETLDLHHYYLNKILGFDLNLPSSISTKELIDTMEYDNKKNSEGVRFVILEELNRIYNPEGDYMVKIEKEYVLKTLNSYTDKS